MPITRLFLVLLATAALSACGGAGGEQLGEAAPPGPMPAPTFANISRSHLNSGVPAVANVPIERSPSLVVQSMLALAESGKWGEVVDRYYGEREKFRSRRDRDGLVSRFEGEWGNRMLEALRNARDLSPTIENDGRATFLDDGVTVFELHKHIDGRWTFRL